MPLPSFLQRFFQGVSGPRPGAEAVSLSQADVEAVRVRARRRLIGMAVLVGAGVIGFPWLFETKPRPMAMDIAVVQQGASAPSVAAAIANKPGVQAKVKSVTQAQSSDEPREEFINEPPKTASHEAMPAKNVAAASKATDSHVAQVKVADKAANADKAVNAEKKSADTKDSKVASAQAQTKPAAPAKPVAAAKPVASAAAAKPVAAADKDKSASSVAVRYVVQIGAYSDVPSAHEVRMKAERAGLKTYTQVIGADANKKIRVRLGPFEDKAAADKAMATLKKAGLPGGLLTL